MLKIAPHYIRDDKYTNKRYYIFHVTCNHRYIGIPVEESAVGHFRIEVVDSSPKAAAMSIIKDYPSVYYIAISHSDDPMIYIYEKINNDWVHMGYIIHLQ